MSGKFLIDIADIRVCIKSASPGSQIVLNNRYKPFLSDGEADVNLLVHPEPMPAVVDSQMVSYSENVWYLFRKGSNWIIQTGVQRDYPYQLGFFASDFREGEIFVRRTAQPGEIHFPLDHPLGELFFINLLSNQIGPIIHCCGIAYQGDGYIFAGRSGVGKSTLSRLWRQTETLQNLSDDRVILRKVDGQYIAYGTPWPGQEGVHSNARAPLAKVFLISHGEKNRVRLLSRSKAVTRLLPACYLPAWDKAKMDYLVSFFDDLTGHVPCYELEFLPDQRVIELLKCLD